MREEQEEPGERGRRVGEKRGGGGDGKTGGGEGGREEEENFELEEENFLVTLRAEEDVGGGVLVFSLFYSIFSPGRRE